MRIISARVSDEKYNALIKRFGSIAVAVATLTKDYEPDVVKTSKWADMGVIITRMFQPSNMPMLLSDFKREFSRLSNLKFNISSLVKAIAAAGYIISVEKYILTTARVVYIEARDRYKKPTIETSDPDIPTSFTFIDSTATPAPGCEPKIYTKDMFPEINTSAPY